MRTGQRLAVGALVAAVLLHAGRAWAPFHVVNVDQVFFGTADCPNAQYVAMRLLAPGMTSINTQMVTTQNADGTTAPAFGTFTANVPNGATGDHFIMGTADAAALFGISMDQTASGSLRFADGRVCFGNFGGMPVDCVAYGNYVGDNGTGGIPATAPVLGMALFRQTNTNNDQSDFALAAPAPVNNAGDTGTLGQCLGGADTPTPTGSGETPTPTATAVPTGTTAACVGDCGGVGAVSISDLITGVNIALGSLPVSSCEAFDCQHNGTVSINCLIQGVNNALAGCPATSTAARDRSWSFALRGGESRCVESITG